MNKTPVAVLIATTPRLELLQKHALKSLSMQRHKPELIVVASDRRKLTVKEHEALQQAIPDVKLISVKNKNSPGAAGSWNTGVDVIATHFNDCYLSIIDDDDEWNESHLSDCLIASDSGKADIVLSGINIVKNGNILDSNIPEDICANDFLTGNPGWQGSNTFIRLSFFQAIGGFTDGLISCNDRDLAIRALENKNATINYTRSASVYWQINHRPDALSAACSKQKLMGASQFLSMYEHRMDSLQKEKFFLRMESLFHPQRDQIKELLQGM